jgi:phenylacetate-CoA ligase
VVHQHSDGRVALSLPPAELGYSAEAIRCLRAVLRGQPVDVIALQREDKVLQYSSDVAGSSSPPR